MLVGSWYTLKIQMHKCAPNKKPFYIPTINVFCINLPTFIIGILGELDLKDF